MIYVIVQNVDNAYQAHIPIEQVIGVLLVAGEDNN